MKPLLTLIVLLSVALAAPGPQPRLYLDVVTFNFSSDAGADDSASNRLLPPTLMGGTSGGPPSRTKLTLTLASTDVTVLGVGDPFVCEVLVENTGSQPVVLPWSPDHRMFPIHARPTMDGSRDALTFLEVQTRRSSRNLAWLDAQSLHGSNDIYGSLQALEPGQKAIIRIPSRFRAMGPQITSLLSEPNGEVQVVAVLVVVRDSLILRSANHIDVDVSPPVLR